MFFFFIREKSSIEMATSKPAVATIKVVMLSVAVDDTTGAAKHDATTT